MNGYNDNITDQQLAKLQELFPEVFTEGGVNWPQLRATLGDAIDGGDSYGLSWKGKSGVFAKIQEKTVETLRPDRDNSVDWDATGNMFIEGDNLAALKILHKSYYGRVKMIYIDPPYNTGNDFVYNDDFKQTRKSYEAEVGIVDDEGNITRDDGLRANTGGHKHSNWLNMMYPRLFLARNLLCQDGVIFVSIDDNEVHNLRLIMNEIFGEENFITQFVWRRSGTGGLRGVFPITTHEYILAYSRNIASITKRWLAPYTKDALSAFSMEDERGVYKTQALYLTSLKQTDSQSYYIDLPDNSKVRPPDGVGSWRFIESTYKKELELGNVVFKEVSNSPLVTSDNKKANYNIYIKQYMSDEGTNPASILPDEIVGQTRAARAELKRLFNTDYFEYAKPISLIKYLISLTNCDRESIILDFFSGSGTTAHAVAELNAEDGGNRRWICVQLPEQTSEKSEAFKAGYANIADIARERIRRAGAKIRTDFAEKIAERETPLDLGFRAYRVGESNFKPWNELVADPEEIRQQLLDVIDPIEPDATDESILTELLLKRGISPLADIEDRGAYLFVPSANLAIRLVPDLTEAELSEILASDAQTILLLARALGLNETLRTNLTLQAEQRGVRVEVV